MKYALNPNDVPEYLKLEYRGKRFNAVVSNTVSLNGMQWSGGSRSTYTLIDLETRTQKPIVDNRPFPQNQYAMGKVTIPPNHAIVQHSIFCGKDMGLTFYVNADNAPFLPAPNTEPLTDVELCLLAATGRYKSSYAGRKPRIDACIKNGFSMADIETAKQSLIDKGYLRKNGSITPDGKNQIPERAHNKFRLY